MPSRFHFPSFASLVLTFVLALPLLARAANNPELQARFKAANAKLEAGELQPAIEIYNEILEARPDADNVWIMRAVAKSRAGDQSGARADLAQALILYPDNVDAYRIRGQIRYQAKDYAGSLADFNKAVGFSETATGRDHATGNLSASTQAAAVAHAAMAELYGMRGEAENQLADNDAALRDLTRAVELNPGYTAAWFTRAQVYERTDNPAAALADYTKVIEQQPNHPDALNNRAWLHFNQREWDAAIADGKKVLEFAPTTAQALRVVGYAQFGQGDFTAAAATLSTAADAASAHPKDKSEADTVAYALFVRHYALLRTTGADDRLAKVSSTWKDDPWQQALAKFITGGLTEEELDTAAQDTTDEGELAGRTCEMHFYIGLARRQAGDRSTARLRFQSALATNQKNYIEDTLATAELQRLK